MKNFIIGIGLIFSEWFKETFSKIDKVGILSFFIMIGIFIIVNNYILVFYNILIIFLMLCFIFIIELEIKTKYVLSAFYLICIYTAIGFFSSSEIYKDYADINLSKSQIKTNKLKFLLHKNIHVLKTNGCKEGKNTLQKMEIENPLNINLDPLSNHFRLKCYIKKEKNTNKIKILN